MTKTKTAKALLASVLALVLCLSMLIGTTFAWFTDSVTSSNNIIKSGNLDVTMAWADGKTDPANTTWTDASVGAIFNYELWEPGYTEVRHIQIANTGSLALKYQLNILANGEVSDLADVIDVYYVDPAVQVSDRAALVDTYKIGTLSEVLAQVSTTASGELAATESDTITIALKMQESAGNEYQNKSIGSDFSVQILATQLTSEPDSFDNQYDAASTYLNQDENGNWLIASAGDLLYVAQQVNSGNTYSGQTLLLANDVDLGNMKWTPIGSKSNGFMGTFDGQEHTVSNFKVEQTEYAGLFGYALNGGNIKNLTVKGAAVKATDRAGAVLGAGYTDLVNCHAVECEITVTPALQANGEYDGGAKAGGVAGQLFEGAGISIVGCTARNVKVTGYRDIGAVLGMAHNNNTVTDCKAYDSQVAYLYLEDGQVYDGNTPNENIGEVVGRRNSGVVESGTEFSNVKLIMRQVYDSVVNGGLYEYLPTLQKGDTLVLPAGTYVTTGTFTIPDGVTIMAAAGEEVIVRQDSAAQDNIFNCEGDVIVRNITFESNRKGYAVNGAAKNHDTDGDITLIGCHFKGLAADKNWGVYKNLNGDLTIKDCTFDNYNNAVCGVNNGGDSVTVITGCTFTNINGEAIGYVASTMPADFEAEVIANNTGLTAENVIGY